MVMLVLPSCRTAKSVSGLMMDRVSTQKMRALKLDGVTYWVVKAPDAYLGSYGHKQEGQGARFFQHRGDLSVASTVKLDPPEGARIEELDYEQLREWTGGGNAVEVLKIAASGDKDASGKVKVAVQRLSLRAGHLADAMNKDAGALSFAVSEGESARIVTSVLVLVSAEMAETIKKGLSLSGEAKGTWSGTGFTLDGEFRNSSGTEIDVKIDGRQIIAYEMGEPVMQAGKVHRIDQDVYGK